MMNKILQRYLLSLSLLMTGCTQTFYIGRFQQAQFTYPNSNVTPLTKVSGTSSTTFKILLPPSITSKVVNEAYMDALSKSQGADVLINVDAYHKVTQIPLPFITLYFSKYMVDGTSAKQEIGKQKLGN
jgi:hypothetical protein